METERYLCPCGLRDGDRSNRSANNIVYELRDSAGRFHAGLHHDYYKRCIPAPSMAELWEWLPDIFDGYELTIKKDGYSLACFYETEPGMGIGYNSSTNPADALGELAIWLKTNNTRK